MAASLGNGSLHLFLIHSRLRRYDGPGSGPGYASLLIRGSKAGGQEWARLWLAGPAAMGR